MEINHFEPVVASRLFDSIRTVTNGARIFSEKCIEGIQAVEERSLSNLTSSSALATVFVPELGYAGTSKLVKQSLALNRPFLSLVIEQGLLDEGKIDAILRQSTVVD